ncbi:cell division cycle 5-like protein [Vitis riparia]|uniref:cell division cycle 5-like protein n=1 Tax=Vitis riparia TaxID=96939 RepID=UPI00155AE17C|nr:cell division cycle 5-like protein [Vitis riparia]
MRIMIKGGVWKNTEDEILKAAVMKYGKNQWARISSLLVRKSAKQCKARWYEWLDPSIKKTEWTREEDEKLLHLAKLMPTQWRTIAPIVGRTPSQCLERYEKLLDAACVKDENYEPGDDPRKLRPGEIDPNPESKPARPDPVDMDEDEKEMLSEARARLANTRGKKAKRKAREKQLEEARRLASLQKRRELKAAGIDGRHRKRKRKGIDYNAEIPFEKKPPPGFFDVTDEERLVEQPKFPTTIEELEGKRRVDVEAQLRKQDVAKNKIAQRQDAPSAILQANKMNDPETVRKRSKLMLPAPQISDHELEEIAKMGYASDLLAGNEELTEGSGATRALLANYSQTPRQGMTPLRTPQRTPAGKGDAIMMEAENLARLRESQTPLLGGENPELHPSDFSGVTPKRRDIQTPNLMLTPSATPGGVGSTPGGVGSTPRISMTPSRDAHSFGITPKGTPIRDELHINEDMDMHDSAKLELRRQADLRRNLRSGLGSLPQPKNEYQVVIQPIPEDNEEPEEKIEEDMSDRLARERAEEEARQQALLRKRSKVLQRELPRPPVASLDLIRNSLMRADEDKSSFVPPTLIEQADEMIRKELLGLLEHDNAKYPLDEKTEKEKKKGGKRSANGKSAGSVSDIEDFEEAELKEADNLIKEEVQFLRVAMGHDNESLDEFVEAHKTCLNDLMYFPTRDAYGLSSVAGNMEKLAALQNEFDNVKKRMEDDTKKAQRLEQKIKLLTHGYQMRAGKLWTQIEATFKQMDTAGTELECFQALQKQEQLAASHRINGLWEEVQKQKELEQTLQSRYGDLIAEQERIQSLIDEYRVQAKIQEEIAAKNRALEVAEAETCQMDVENPEPAAADELGNSVQVDPSHGGLPDQKMDSSQEEYHTSPKHDADADADAANHITVAGLETPDAVAASDVLGNSFPADPSHDEMPGQKPDAAEGEAHASPNPDVNVGAENETIVPDTETAEPVCPSDELGKSMPVGSSRDGTPNDQMGAVQAEAYASTKLDGDVGAEAQDGGGS